MADKPPFRKPEHAEVRSARTAVSVAANALAAVYSDPQKRADAQKRLAAAHRALDAAVTRNPP